MPCRLDKAFRTVNFKPACIAFPGTFKPQFALGMQTKISCRLQTDVEYRHANEYLEHMTVWLFLLHSFA